MSCLIEATVIDYLNNVLSVPVSGEVPSPTPPVFVTVEKIGSSVSNHLRSAMISVDIYAGSEADAAALNVTVRNAMEAMITLSSISRSHCETDYNFTDTATKHNRYQAVFEVVYYE